jgi:hypothetical protein
MFKKLKCSDPKLVSHSVIGDAFSGVSNNGNSADSTNGGRSANINATGRRKRGRSKGRRKKASKPTSASPP